MKLWRIRLHPTGYKRLDVLNYCLKNEIIGIGWNIESQPTGREDYKVMFRNKFKTLHSWPNIENFINANIDDLVWTNIEQDYYLGRIEGDWSYIVNGHNTGLYNIRKCKLYLIGSMSDVPGSVLNLKQCTFGAASDERDGAILYSMICYNEKSNNKYYNIDKTINEDSFCDLLFEEDFEDIIGIYLQKNKYYLISSTAKKSTEKIEYELISHDGKKIAVQAKSGNTKINISEYKEIENKFDELYLYSSKGFNKDKSAHDKIKYFGKEEIVKFAKENKTIMPERVKRWMDYCHM